MTILDSIIGADQQQLTLDDLLTTIEVENGPYPHILQKDDLVTVMQNGGENGGPPHFEPGTSVGHADYAEFRAVYIGPGRRPEQALVKVVSGWTCELPAYPVTIPYLEV